MFSYSSIASYIRFPLPALVLKPTLTDVYLSLPLQDAPQQYNGFDCGIFTCQFLEYLSRGKESPFNFTQKDMPYIRKRMIWEIGNAKFMPHDEDS